MPSLHVLVIEDEPAARQVLAAALSNAGYWVESAANVAEATAKLARGDVDAALCDIQLPDGDGIELLKRSRELGFDTAFVMVTAFSSVETAVEALRAGAFDYIIKPVRHPEVLHRLMQIEAISGLRVENKALRNAVRESKRLFPFTSSGMRQVERLVDKIAPTDSTVLITGESGTGKSVVARTIHERSERRDGPFLQVNCGAIPDQLLESEFFGHTKGAFTGADRARKGLFVEADRGTLFLDEISELPPHMQTKLLHVIEDKIVRPIGSEQARHVDTRIVVATNRDLQEMVAQGKFREDLYFRLSMFHIHVPPLRERQGDIPGLIGHLLHKAHAGGNRAGPIRMEPGIEEILFGYSWPGNVRQLENVISRALILAEGDYIVSGDLPAEVTRNAVLGAQAGTRIADSGYLRDQLRKFEGDVVRCAVEAAGGDRRLAAQRLGIGLSSLYRKLEELERDGLLAGVTPGSPPAEH